MRMVVDSKKETALQAVLKNDGHEPAYGMILEINSTVLLPDLPSDCGGGKDNEV